jgi:VCBS repeat-containing protein
VVWVNETDDDYFNDSYNQTGIVNTTVTSTSGTFNIDGNMEVSGSVVVTGLGAGSANVTLALQTLVDGNWVNVATDSHSGAIVNLGELASLDLSTLDLDAGTYRVQTTMQTPLVGGLITTINTSIDVDVLYTDQFEVESVVGDSGNLLANDEPGSSFTTLQIFDGTDFVDVTGTVQVQGQFGVLTVDAEGNYSYTPDTNLAHFDTPQLDSFAYQLVHPVTGAVEQGALNVTVEPSGAGVMGGEAEMMMMSFSDDVVGFDGGEEDGGSETDSVGGDDLDILLEDGQNISLIGLDSLDAGSGEDDGAFVAEVPELAGCAADGASADPHA